MYPRSWHVEVEASAVPLTLRAAATRALWGCRPQPGLRWYRRATSIEVRRPEGLVRVPDASRSLVFFLDRHTIWLSVDQTLDELTETVRHELQRLRDLARETPPRSLAEWLALERRARNSEGIAIKHVSVTSDDGSMKHVLHERLTLSDLDLSGKTLRAHNPDHLGRLIIVGLALLEKRTRTNEPPRACRQTTTKR